MNDGPFQKVLVPVEFETLAEDETTAGEAVEFEDQQRVVVGPYTLRALELAARLARGGELWLVHVHHRFSDYATWMDPGILDELNVVAAQHARGVLLGVAARHCPEVELHCVIEARSSPVDALLEVAEARSVQAIVLAASSRGRVQRAFHGSTADRLIRRARCPVMVVPSGTP